VLHHKEGAQITQKPELLHPIRWPCFDLAPQRGVPRVSVRRVQIGRSHGPRGQTVGQGGLSSLAANGGIMQQGPKISSVTPANHPSARVRAWVGVTQAPLRRRLRRYAERRHRYHMCALGQMLLVVRQTFSRWLKLRATEIAGFIHPAGRHQTFRSGLSRRATNSFENRGVRRTTTLGAADRPEPQSGREAARSALGAWREGLWSQVIEQSGRRRDGDGAACLPPNSRET